MIFQCRVCHGCYTEPNMETDDLCIKCWATEELKKEGGDVDLKANRKKQGDKGLPVAGERETNQETPKGQMELCLSGD